MSYGYDALNRLSRVTTTASGTELFYSGYSYGTVGGSDSNRRSNLPQSFDYHDAS